MTKRVIILYKTRMQIEESLHNIKNSIWGFTLDEAKAVQNLLRVCVLAIFAVWLTGKVAE